MLKIQYQTNSGVDDENLHVIKSSFFCCMGLMMILRWFAD
jgi:hypothetical protein